VITLIKLGGSLITDKNVQSSFREDAMKRIASEIHAARMARPDVKMILGHGSGSFGHFEAKKYNTMDGVHTPEEWHGFTRVAAAAAQLNYLVSQVCCAQDLPVVRYAPSASALAREGTILDMSLKTLERALDVNLIPLVYGDVAFDTVRGGTIVSTETVFTYLAQNLPVTQILLLGEVDGVYDLDQKVIPRITPSTYESIKPALKGSGGVDVTGGMLTKVEDMLSLIDEKPYLSISIFNGHTPGLLQQALMGESILGTVIAQN
jgi:isopentenyl phosphate kinase